MKKAFFVFLMAILAGFTAHAQSDPFTGSRWQGRISYRDAGGQSRSELYELILVPNGTCVVTVSGRAAGSSQDVFQDADGLWSFDETFFRLECDFPEPVFEHLSALNWASVYQFDALKSRFTLLVKPYPGAANTVKAAFNKVDD
ncbi:MAG: hypothetical protein LBQ38_08080 [Spirochaetaceae bacterium]|jgi:hypothetical protein|nr:hypothetical protein [Spirochaetaceae bacterium]